LYSCFLGQQVCDACYERIIVVSRRQFQIFVSSIIWISSHYTTTNISCYNCSISQISPPQFWKASFFSSPKPLRYVISSFLHQKTILR